MISVQCLAELLQCFSRFHVVSCFTAFSARQLSVETSVFASSPLHGDPVISRKIHKFVGVSQSVLSSNTHEFLACVLSMTSQPPRGRGAAAPSGYTAPL